MSASRLALLASLGLLAVPLTAWAAEPPPIPAPTVFSQPNPYDVWQAYGVDRYGRFRPLVVLTPAGPFRVSDGAYYPFMPTQQMNVIPTVTDSLGPVPPQPPVHPPVTVRRRGWLR